MSQNKLIVDEITTLRLLLGLRENMQKYSCGSREPLVVKNLLQGYALFADAAEVNAKIFDIISQQLVPTTFNPYAFKSCDADEHKKQKKQADKNQEKNKSSSLVRKQLLQELEYQHSLGKMSDVSLEADFRSIRLTPDAFLVFVENRQEPLIFPLRQRNGKYFSTLGTKAVSNPAFAKKGFDNNTYKLLLSLGDDGLKLIDPSKKLLVSQKYSATQYKSYLGLDKSSKLNDEQQKELDILNSLLPLEQKRFILAVKERTNEQKNYKNFFATLQSWNNPLKNVADKTQLKNLFVENGLPDCSEAVTQQIIQDLIQNDKTHLWNYFVKKNTENTYFAYSDILTNNILVKNKKIFQNVLDFDDNSKMKENLKQVYSQLKRLAVPVLPDNMAAELLALGIFQQALFSHPTQKKLQNMNLLLNELGLNVNFVEEKVVKVPELDIQSAYEQAKIDRFLFEKNKVTPLSKKQYGQFKSLLSKMKMENLDNIDTHHYLALRYQAFIKPNLNHPDNYVRTARQHPWNIDGHAFVHNFDVAGEFLVADSEGNLDLMDFNTVRRAFNHGKSLTLQIPIIQEKSENGTFRDILPCKNFGAENPFYVSSDQNAHHFIKLPTYLTQLFAQKNRDDSHEI